MDFFLSVIRMIATCDTQAGLCYFKTLCRISRTLLFYTEKINTGQDTQYGTCKAPTFRQLSPAAELNTSTGESQVPPEPDTGDFKSSFH